MRVTHATLWVATALGAAVEPSHTRAQSPTGQQLQALVDARADSAFALYRGLLSLPNDATYPEDILEVLAWLEREFQARAFETRRLDMPGSDALLATRSVPNPARTVLVYLQADGQPVDTTAWDQASPWEPVLKQPVDGGWEEIAWERLESPERNPEWRMFARSASDSKGPIAQFLIALDVLADAGIAPDYDLKVIIDTEEEKGSPHLPDAVRRYSDELAADMLVIFDGPPHASGQPTVTFGARGIARFTLTAYGPRVAQHSGHWGNYVPNPAMRLARLLASMKDESGRVTIPGFYDGVSIDADTRRILEDVPDDIAAIHQRMGIAEPDGVAATPQEAIQYPSLNVRGMRAAWVGAEARTIIPPEAIAEVDVRLVLESDPDRLLNLVREHIEAQGYHVVTGRNPTDEERATHPKLARFDSNVSYLAYRTPFDSEPGRWTATALEQLFGREPVRIRTSGGSIPISPFVTTLELPAVSVGTVNPDNNQHSPNENLRVFDFLRGIRMIAAILGHPLTRIVSE